jgi:hypothetical protein
MFEFLTKRPKRVLRVKFLRSVNACGIDNTTASGRAIGAVLDVSDSEAGNLEDAVTILGEVGADGNLIVKPVKRAVATYKREAVPARWKELPAHFTTLWNLLQDLGELRFKAKAAEKALGPAKYERGSVTEAETLMTDAAKKFIHAQDAVKNFNHEGIQRALLACSNTAVSEIRSVDSTRAELERVAFEIFSLRAAALELNEGHLRRLFSGSALFRNYVFPVMSLHDMRSAGHGHVYMDAPVTSIAQRVFNAREFRAKLEPLLEKAKAERDAAAGVTRGKSKLLTAA